MTQSFTPEFLTRWTLPKCYMGAHWEEYYGAGVSQHRDSDCHSRANFDAMLAALKTIPEPADWPHDEACFQRVRENHWAVGWVEWIAIHEDATAHLELADKINGKLENYPVIDEELWGRYENEEAQTIWRDCYNVRERVAYIRDNRREFEFRNFADMLGCVKGYHRFYLMG